MFDPAKGAAELAAWRAEVAQVLRKAGKLREGESPSAPESKIAWFTHDGLSIRALYTFEEERTDVGLPGAFPYVRGATNGRPALGWDVRAVHEGPDARTARAEVLSDLENGASSLWLRMQGGGGSLPPGSLEETLFDVRLDLVAVALSAGPHFESAAHEIALSCKRTGLNVDSTRIFLGLDPIGERARLGDASNLSDAATFASRIAREHHSWTTFTVDATVYHEAGATEALELGYSIATGLAYVRALASAGVPVEAAVRQVEFRYAATVDQFLTMAKLRAARQLWARVADVCGTSAGQVQHVVTSRTMMTTRDPWVNMLRTTIAAFAAGTGGASSVTVWPFDCEFGAPDEFSRRMARGTQALLLEESSVGRVLDPAGGSFYVEALTRELARAGWEAFRTIERTGGMLSAVDDGTVRAQIDARWTEREKNLARRKEAITGVSEFAHLFEKPVRPLPAPRANPAPSGLPTRRLSAAYEALRLSADGHREKTGTYPRVLLIALGPLASHTARVTFMSNLLQAGGIEGIVTEPVFTPDDLARSLALYSTHRVVCLCGTDASYAEMASWAVPALSASNAYVLLAGKEAALEGTGVQVNEAIAFGCDAVTVLTKLHERLEVRS